MSIARTMLKSLVRSFEGRDSKAAGGGMVAAATGAATVAVDASQDAAAWADPAKLGKATRFVERYREIVSDPLNLLIARVPEAGYVDAAGCVILHNGHRVPVRGELAYYAEFSDILVINRGVHEPLEEYCFQQMLARLRPARPAMIELGAYWAHYSMWMKQARPEAICVMVEPDEPNLRCGRNNFAINGYAGEFIQAFVGARGFRLDPFTSERGIAALDVLHVDIQGFELEMLDGAQRFFSAQRVAHAFVSTHSQSLHDAVVARLRDHGYRIEVSSGFDTHTTGCDGFILATAPTADPVFPEGFAPLGREEIARASPEVLLASLASRHT